MKILVVRTSVCQLLGDRRNTKQISAALKVSAAARVDDQVVSIQAIVIFQRRTRLWRINRVFYQLDHGALSLLIEQPFCRFDWRHHAIPRWRRIENSPLTALRLAVVFMDARDGCNRESFE